MGRKKQLPKRRRFTSPKRSLFHYAWSMKSPDSFRDDFISFVEMAIEREQHWIDTTGRLEFAERNSKRREAQATYLRLFTKKIDSIEKPGECFFNEQEERQLKVVDAYLKNSHSVLSDEFHLRTQACYAARSFLFHCASMAFHGRKESHLMDLPYTTPN